MADTATAKAPKAKKAKEKAQDDPLAFVGKPKEETLKVKDVLVFKALQLRKDCDEGQVVDVDRATSFAAKMKEGAKFPRIKVVRVTDAPGHKDKEVLVCWDGIHTHAACEIAKIGDIECLVWTGTWAQARYAADALANKEHDENGKPFSTKEKIAAVMDLAKVYMDNLPKSQWPSNRQLAEKRNVSHQHVNNLDPFGRSGVSHEQKKALKKADRAITNGHAPAATGTLAQTGTVLVPNNQLDPKTGDAANFEIVQRTTGQPVAKYHAKDKEAAIKRFQADAPNKPLTDYVCREFTPDPASLAAQVNPAKLPEPGTAAKPPGFDWATMQANLGYVIRGHDAMGDLFALKADAEYKKAFAHLDLFTKWLDDTKKKHGKKK